MSSFHVGDNISMSGSNNVGKVEGGYYPTLTSSRNAEMRHPTRPVWNEPLVFVNYRFNDELAATQLHSELGLRLGAEAVFRDRDMLAGTEFPQELFHRASTCQVMLVVVGERWDDAEGLRLLHDPADWVHREIAVALSHRVEVIPILVGARGQLTSGNLPADIRRLAELQYRHLPSGYREQDVERLVESLVYEVPALAAAAYRRR